MSAQPAATMPRQNRRGGSANRRGGSAKTVEDAYEDASSGSGGGPATYERNLRASLCAAFPHNDSLSALLYSIDTAYSCTRTQSAVRRSFQHLRRRGLHSVNVVNFQSTVFISNFMHMRDKTVCGF